MRMNKSVIVLLSSLILLQVNTTLLASESSTANAFAESLLAKRTSALKTENAKKKQLEKKKIGNIKKVMREITASGFWKNTPFACYAVNPISPIKRLPDTIPPDGELSGKVCLMAAKGEFEPASFVIFSFKNIDNVKLEVSNLKTRNGNVIPADAIDIKVVKCWYQAGTAWGSYFGDSTERILIPELLLKDENLIKVDCDTQDNYLKINYPKGAKYVWISYTEKTDAGYFNFDTEPVADAKTLMPIRLVEGESKQIWLTAHVPKNAKPGLYNGEIAFKSKGAALGRMNIDLRVLPFSLPEPRTYYDINKKFYPSIYNHCSLREHLQHNGGDIDMASRKLLAEYQNMRDHGCMYPLMNLRRLNRTQKIRQLKVMKESGLKTKPIFGGFSPWDYTTVFRKKSEQTAAKWKAFTDRVDASIALFDEILGHHDIFPVGFDEPGKKTLIGERKSWKYVHEKGARIMSTSKNSHLKVTGYNEDFSNYGGFVRELSEARSWHAVGGRIATYASPHTGPENPDFIRRTHGMILYKMDLD
ncbi:MAG: hypothetical protein KAG97_11875, partial [Victivallales bacterium]|nr:hypothetical protein [Victivallales bacterium]